MFEGTKITSEIIKNEIPVWLQNLLWYMVEIMEVKEKAQIQVFELSHTVKDGENKQRIVHYQYQPYYYKEYIFSAKSIVNVEVVIIYYASYVVMLKM